MAPHSLRMTETVTVKIVPLPLPRRPHGCMVYIYEVGRKYSGAAWFKNGRLAAKSICMSYRWAMFWARGMAALSTIATIRENVAAGYLPDSVLDPVEAQS